MARGRSAGGVGSVEELAEALGRVKPASAVAVGPDGEQTPLALSGSKGKWVRAARVAWDCEATLVQCMDDAGRVLAMLRIRPTTDETSAPAAADGEQPLGEVARAVIEGQRLALSHQFGLVQLIVGTTRDLQAMAVERAQDAERARVALMRREEAAIEAAAASVEQQAAQVAEHAQTVEAERTAIATASTPSPVDGLVMKLLDHVGPVIAARIGEQLMAQAAAAEAAKAAGGGS